MMGAKANSLSLARFENGKVGVGNADDRLIHPVSSFLGQLNIKINNNHDSSLLDGKFIFFSYINPLFQNLHHQPNNQSAQERCKALLALKRRGGRWIADAATLTERKVRARNTFHALSASCVFDESKIFPPIKF